MNLEDIADLQKQADEQRAKCLRNRAAQRIRSNQIQIAIASICNASTSSFFMSLNPNLSGEFVAEQTEKLFSAARRNIELIQEAEVAK